MSYQSFGGELKQLRAANLDRLNSTPKYEPCLKWDDFRWACSMAGEMGEACDTVKKMALGTKTKEDLAKELADVIIYADLLAWYHGIDLWAAIVQKFDEVSDRVGSAVKLGDATKDWPPKVALPNPDNGHGAADGMGGHGEYCECSDCLADDRARHGG